MTASVTTLHDPGTEVVTVHGEIDLASAPELRDALDAAIEATGAGVLVDLTDVSFLDSTALATFVAARAHAAEAGTTLELVCPNPNIQRIFAITALNRVFSIRAEAPPALSAGAAPRLSREGAHSMRLTASDESPAAARLFVGLHLSGLADDLLDDVLLLVSEVVTNAVRYGGDELELRLSASADRVRVEVRDPDPDDLPDAPGQVAVTAGRGRGLLIVAALASDWGVMRTDSGAKIVWFELGHRN